ncbi:MAG: DNA repair protein RadA [Muribaculaceae bacterium]|nr:DNA repair protein RadA [Muribaculaceae bacterium]
MAKKVKTVYFCNNCGNESPKWLGKCPACGEWNTFVEEKVTTNTKSGKSSRTEEKVKPVKLSEIENGNEIRIPLPSKELNRVLGGGLVAGSLTLLGGEPGIGKSTLLLQNILSMRSKKILYISGEESGPQIKMRADRLSKAPNDTFILCETDLDNIFNQIENIKPDLIIVDSIQTIHSPAIESVAGSVSQVRECAAEFLKFAKQSGIPVILVGHINKDGAIAGPKVLEHIVDTVLQFEGDRQYLFRILRSIKNRFGSTSEIGIYEMVEKGLREVANPSNILISDSTDKSMSGIGIGVTTEGIRPFLVEVQALVSNSAYATPQRSVTGFDQRRLNMLLAVLEKRAKLRFAQKDVFLNITGGLKIIDPALDLAVMAAIMSSYFDIPIPTDMAFIGEVGLSGEVRTVTRIETRISEAAKMGFSKIIIPKGNLKGVTLKNESQVVEISKIEQCFKIIHSIKG